MSDTYTPTTEEVRFASAATAVGGDGFDRWLAAHDAELLDSAANSIYHDGLAPWPAVAVLQKRAAELRVAAAASPVHDEGEKR